MIERQRILNEYAKYTKNKPVIISSPGRINIIGEHTDYNHGFVLPAAIDKRMVIALGKERNSQKIKIKSIDFDEEVVIDLSNLINSSKG